MGFQTEAADGAQIHVVAVKAKSIGAGFFGSIHGNVGQPQQSIGIACIIGIDADADSRTECQFGIVDDQRNL